MIFIKTNDILKILDIFYRILLIIDFLFKKY